MCRGARDPLCAHGQRGPEVVPEPRGPTLRHWAPCPCLAPGSPSGLGIILAFTITSNLHKETVPTLHRGRGPARDAQAPVTSATRQVLAPCRCHCPHEETCFRRDLALLERSSRERFKVPGAPTRASQPHGDSLLGRPGGGRLPPARPLERHILCTRDWCPEEAAGLKRQRPRAVSLGVRPALPWTEGQCSRMPPAVLTCWHKRFRTQLRHCEGTAGTRETGPVPTERQQSRAAGAAGLGQGVLLWVRGPGKVFLLRVTWKQQLSE